MSSKAGAARACAAGFSTATSKAGPPIKVSSGNRFPFDLVITADGKTAYVALANSTLVVPIDTAANKPGTPFTMTRQGATWLDIAPALRTSTTSATTRSASPSPPPSLSSPSLPPSPGPSARSFPIAPPGTGGGTASVHRPR